jgi:hypothetical protein
MNDRELLELAAKAAGIELKYDTFGQSENADRVYCYWNPLTDDGDALRLAVKLGLMGAPRHTIDFVAALADSDPYAATRRAIVRAAAEIGKEM